jgi:hypothetical protein
MNGEARRQLALVGLWDGSNRTVQPSVFARWVIRRRTRPGCGGEVVGTQVVVVDVVGEHVFGAAVIAERSNRLGLLSSL